MMGNLGPIPPIPPILPILPTHPNASSNRAATREPSSLTKKPR
jgi:hypothetical protein